MKEDFSGKRVAILGAGVEGQVLAGYLRLQNATVMVLDERAELDSDITAAFTQLGVAFTLGAGAFAHLSTYDQVFRSPGIPLSRPELAEVIAQNKLSSQTKLFFDLCPCPIIGITGTKGKGTTVSMIYEMLKVAGIDVFLGGNIGTPPLTFLSVLTPESCVVLELSSFQLEDLTKSPHIGVMLMVTSEHLDHHKNTAEYIQAKRNLLAHQTPEDFAIVNRDYPASNESDIVTEALTYYVSTERTVATGCFVREGSVWVSYAGKEKKIIDTDEILLPGKHNLENVCAAVMAAILAEVEVEEIVGVLKTFKGLEHRLELVGEVAGVRYYDDSFSTTPETAIAAIEAFQEPKILILGGSQKNSDFTELGKVIGETESIKAVIGIGVEWLLIKEKIAGKLPLLTIEGAKDMHQIVLAAQKVATPGDVVLLSPACASFDMFKNYKERGDLFKKEVLAL